MDRIQELKILIPQLTKDLESMKIYSDGSGLLAITKKTEQLAKYHIELFKLQSPNLKLPDFLEPFNTK